MKLKGSDIKKYVLILMSIVFILLIVYLITLLFIMPYLKICNNDSCFVDKANKCEEVKMEKIISGSTYGFYENNCTFIKTVKEMNKTELKPVIDILQSKNMTCLYKPKDFDENLITTIFLGTTNCEGSLKDALDTITSIDWPSS